MISPALLEDPVTQTILGIVVLVLVSLIALYGLSRLRSINAHNLQIEEAVRRNFHEMRTEGDLDDQEFRKIEALLARNPSSKQRPELTNERSSNHQ
ncbi:MAG: hypothetical protein NTV29_05885 [Planctomycetota bacterium]|nr:hypothetical protein [Planctomycetota bacterium]